MTKGELRNLYIALTSLGNIKGAKFSYAVAKNIAMLSDEMKALDKAIMPSDEFNKYDEERVELVKKYAKKDDKGNPETREGKILGTREFVIENMDEVNHEINILQAKYPNVIKERNKQIDDYNALLREEVVMSFHKVLLADIPEDITSAQMTAIYPIVTE